MEAWFLDGLSFLENIDFVFITYILLAAFCIFWLFVVGWVWFDASERYSSVWLRLFAVFIVFLFNILGFLVYLIVRPRITKDDDYWMDLERRYLKFEAAGLEDCPRCRWEVLPNYVFCPNCGKRLRKKCKSCETYLEPEWDVCPFCGNKQREFDVNEKFSRKVSVKKKERKSVLKGVKKWFVGSDGLVRLKSAVSFKGKKKDKVKDKGEGKERNEEVNNEKRKGKRKDTPKKRKGKKKKRE